MGPADLWGHQWTGILLSASLLTTWSPPAAAQLTLSADPLSTIHNSLAKPILSLSQGTVTEHRDMVTFHCDTVDTNVTIHWVSNSLPLVLNERMQLSADGKNLTILTVQRVDSGKYQCEVWGDGEIRSSDVTFLEVNYGPDSVQIKPDSGVSRGDVVEVAEGSTVNLRAETQSHPAPAYTWYLPTHSIFPSTEATFTIHAVAREHEGLYRCLVSNNATQLSRLGALKLQILGSQSSSLSAGAIAGIVIAGLAAIALATGLGYFLYSRHDRGLRRRSADDPIPAATQPTSEEDHPTEPRPNKCRPVCDDKPDTWGQIRGKEVVPPDLSLKFYENDPPSAGDCSSSSRKPLPRLPVRPLVPPVPKGNTESNYEALVNPEPNIYCRMNPSI